MPTFNAYPNADGYWSGSGTFNTTGTDFVAGYTGTNFGAFFRLTGVTIASGSTITAATQDYTKNSGAGTPDIRIACEAADNATFPSSKADAEGRTITSSYANITSLPADGRRTTPDFSASVQEVIDRGGWASGNAIQVHWRDNKATGSNFIQGRCIERTGTADDPYFSITYTAPAKAQPVFRRRTRTFKQRW